MHTTQRDRRRHVRRGVEKACKVYHPASRRYAPARAVNVSEGGALVVVEGWRRLAPGDEIDMVIAWTSRPVLPADAMWRGRVVRAEMDDSARQTVGVEFDQAVAVQIAA
jgi:c-di-GMP-binding flagellar brake protein YcgR